MSKPSGSIKQVHLPTDATGVNHDIIPDAVGNGSYKASCPTLSADATLALTSDLPIKEIGSSSSSDAPNLFTMDNGFYVWKANTYIKLGQGAFLKNSIDGILYFQQDSYAYIINSNIYFQNTPSTCPTNGNLQLLYINKSDGSWQYHLPYYAGYINNSSQNETRYGIYAPTSAGTAGQILQSNGSGNAPTWVNASSGSATDVQVNGTSITNNGVANIVTYTPYNASVNKLATMADFDGYVKAQDNFGTPSAVDPFSNYYTKNEILNVIYPIGSVRLSFNDGETNFMGGTWVKITDSFLVGAGNSYNVGATGGSTTHSHDLGANGYAKVAMEWPNSNAIYIGQHNLGYNVTYNRNMTSLPGYGSSNFGNSTVADLGGTTETNTVLPPYIAVYIYRRTS